MNASTAAQVKKLLPVKLEWTQIFTAGQILEGLTVTNSLRFTSVDAANEYVRNVNRKTGRASRFKIVSWKTIID